jgi:hypothetical protein
MCAAFSIISDQGGTISAQLYPDESTNILLLFFVFPETHGVFLFKDMIVAISKGNYLSS